VLNATFNTALATTRFEAAGAMLKILGGQGFTTGTGLFRLAKVEVDDALRVLNEVPDLGGAAKTALQDASTALADMIATSTVDGRKAKIDNIRTLLVTAANGFGSNLTYTIGDGPVMF
jgi:hypothetical protein